MSSSLRLPVAVFASSILVAWAVRRWAERGLDYSESVAPFGQLFRLTLIENVGVAFGLLGGSAVVPWVAAFALLVLVLALARPLASSRMGGAALGLILGGGAANLLDRFGDGRVTDYLDVGLESWRWPIFNLPDVAVVAGLVVAAWALLGRGEGETKGHEPRDSAGAGRDGRRPPRETLVDRRVPRRKGRSSGDGGRITRRQMLEGSLVVAASSLLASCLPSARGEQRPRERREPKPPNVVLILTDDLTMRDLDSGNLEHMPSIKSELVERGTTFENSFATNPLCCPSRATILRGQYTHNHQILANEPPLGGFEKFRVLGHENSTMATWLKERGYRTALFGKYLNGYADTYIPPGWDEWHAVTGNFLSDDLNENGRVATYDAEGYHLDDVISEKTSDYITRTAGADPPFFTSDRPFFAWIGTKAPHQPATPAPKYADALPDARLPRPPSFDEGDVSDKPDWVADNPPLSAEQVLYMEELNRKRLQSMLSVDDLVGELVEALRKSGKLENTYIFFTSDNGFHLGQHRLGAGKWTAYEEDIRVPLIVRGPGVPESRTLQHMVLNNDLAPTFADLAGAKTPSFVDGRSLAPLLSGDPPPPEDWRRRFLIESVAERGAIPRPPLVDESAVTPILTGDPLPKGWRRTSAGAVRSSEEWGRPWMKALRTEEHLYVEYKTGERELYDLGKDPYELDNAYATAPPELKRRLEEQLDALRQCSGGECRAAEDD